MRTLGWILVAANLIGAAALYFGRDGGDAATRGLGRGLGGLLAALALVGALLLWWGDRASGRGIAFFVALAILVIPPACLMLFKTDWGLTLLYPSRRGIPKPGPAARYDFPNAATREVALAVIMQDYARVESLIKMEKPDLAARDELGQALLGIATHHTMIYGAKTENLIPLRLLLAAGAVPRPDDAGPDELMISKLAQARDDVGTAALKMLLDAGLSPNQLDGNGLSVLFHDYLTPDAARVLLANGVSRAARDPRANRQDWSPVTHQVDVGNWATAHLLLESGIPVDYASPPGTRFTLVMQQAESQASDEDLADPSCRALVGVNKVQNPGS